MFKNPFSFEGRIRRTEYGLSQIIYVAVVVVLSLLIELNESLKILAILLLPLLWFMFAQGAKRCHDRGNSGWYMFIPFYGLWMLFADSEHGSNEYGPNPKGIGNTDDVNSLGENLVE